jgi:Peptidase family M28
LAIARTIKRLSIKFRSNVELVVFAGEEQGLFGSQYYARTFVRLQCFVSYNFFFKVNCARKIKT